MANNRKMRAQATKNNKAAHPTVPAMRMTDLFNNV